MAKVFVIPFHHIDWRDMIAPPSIADGMDENVQTVPCTREQAARAFRKSGWEGEGQLGVIWLPPFVFESGDTQGECIWLVKLPDHGTSWLLAAEPYDCPGVKTHGVQWQPLEV